MVKRRLFISALLVAFIFLAFVGATAAQIQFHINYEYAKIWINQDGSIDLLYNMSVACDSGVIHWVKVGQPNYDFTIVNAQDNNNQTLLATSTGDGVQVDVPDFSSGQTTRFSLLTRVRNMIFDDTQNPGNLGMQFIPTWYDANILDLRMLIILPPGVTWKNVHTSEPWDNNLTENGRLAIYWEKQNLSPNTQYMFGVSFPKEYLPNYQPPSVTPPVTPPTEPPGGQQPTGITTYAPWLSTLFILGVLVVLISSVVMAVRKRPYLIPSLSMETLGIRHGLTAVEASYLLDVKPTKIVTEILYSLLQKRAIWVESTTPSLKLKIMPLYQDKAGPQETPIRYYEIDFLNAIKEDGTLDEEKLAHTVMFLRDTLEQKMRGYCRRDTIDYYRNVVVKAWEQVEQAGTPELASKAYDEQLLWLFLDPNYQSRTQTAFQNRVFVPSPSWLWYWYGYQHYFPNPTYKPTVETPSQTVGTATRTVEVATKAAQPTTTAQEAKAPTIPGADFANNIATAVENTSNNIVANLEKFANAIVPLPLPAEKTSTQPAHHASSCVCACVACACVCACVSCACACASGGVG